MREVGRAIVLLAHLSHLPVDAGIVGPSMKATGFSSTWANSYCASTMYELSRQERLLPLPKTIRFGRTQGEL